MWGRRNVWIVVTTLPLALTSGLDLVPFLQIEAYALSQGYPEKCLYSQVLEQFALEAQQEQVYFLCNHEGQVALARGIDTIDPLTLAERHIFCIAPVDAKNRAIYNAFIRFVEQCALHPPLITGYP
jgi:hypothetical protein